MADNVDDGDIFDSWEDAAESGELERRMEEREKDLLRREKLSLDIETTVNEKPVMILRPDNGSRTEYTPQIRILRRSPNELTNANHVQKKTEEEMKQALKQKEANYLVARNRILGENYDESKMKLEVKQEESNVRISIIKNPSRNTSPVTTNGVISLSSPILTTSSERSLASP